MPSFAMPTATTSLSVRDIILNSADGAPPGRIDDLVLLSTDLCMFLASDEMASQTAYVDVPVDRVVALGRSDFTEASDTWRTAVCHLTCNDWSDSVFDYFDAPLLDESFPPHSSQYEMRLTCIGGLCQVSNGNHRLVAGRAWLTAKYGNSACWKQAKVRYEPLTEPGREILLRAAQTNSGLRVANFNLTHKQLICGEELITRLAVLSNRPTQIYGMGEKALLPFKNPWHFNLHRKLDWTSLGKLSWHEIPAEIVKRMLDDTWITSQLSRR